jgi:ribosomal-protein-alanine N-acetyltransferase
MEAAPILVTKRLALREMTLADLDFVAAMLADPEVMRFYPRCYSREEAEAWVRRQVERYARYGHGLWLVVDHRSGEAVGQVGLTIQDVDGVQEPEVGYLIHRPFWRRGLATEAAVATRDYAFNCLDKARVISLIRPENVPSQGVAVKMGMAVEKPTLHAGLVHLVFAVSRPKSA